MNRLPIYISSCQKYSDCWEPFCLAALEVSSSFFSDFEVILLTDTNSQDFSFNGLQICTYETSDWGLMWEKHLNVHKSEFFIYLQEDYFMSELSILAPSFLSKAILTVPRLGNLYLSKKYCRKNSWKTFNISDYQESLCAFTDLQAALWNRNFFLDLLARYQNPWIFEICGRRYASRSLQYKSYTVVDPLIAYTHTGVNKGKWSIQGIIRLSQLGYDNDFFSARGVYVERKIADKLYLILKVINPLRPSTWRNLMDLVF